MNTETKVKEKTNINIKINNKRLLCNNMLNSHECKYNKLCLYAHSLSEQTIDPIRKQVYDLLNSNANLNNLNLLENQELLNGLIELKRSCNFCIKKCCPGGYNCKNGAVSNNYKICYEDLMFNNCLRQSCDNIHLTKRNLVCYYKQLNNSQIKNNLINSAWSVPLVLEETKVIKEELKVKEIKVNNIMLFDKLRRDNLEQISDSDESIENIEEMIKFINSGIDNNPYEESIFGI